MHELLYRHSGLVLALVFTVNGAIWWRNGVRQYPERRRGYRSLVLGFVLGGAAFGLAWELAAALDPAIGADGLPGVRQGSPLEWLLAGLWGGLVVAGSYWMFFRGGAGQLARHPGLLVSFPPSPWAYRIAWAVLVLGGVFGWVLTLAGISR